MKQRPAEARPVHPPPCLGDELGGAVGPSGQSVVALLQRAAAESAAGAVAGVRLLDRSENETWVPFHELWQGARSLACGLRAAGLARGERVGLVFPTGRSFLECFFGVLAAGGVPAPLYPPVRLPRLEEYQERTARMLLSIDASLLLADRQVRRILGPVVLGSQPRLGCLAPDELPVSEELPELQASNEDELALVQFSSGTTVDPKPVALTHRALLAQVSILNSFWPDDDALQHSGVSWLPLYHDMGLIGCILPAVERPAVLTLIPPEVFVARPAVWLRAISRFRGTVSPAPNFAYGLCVDRIRDRELEGCDLSSWRVALNGAEAVAPSVLRAFARRFASWGFRPEALTPVYGLSEAALAVTFSDVGQPFRAATFEGLRLREEGRARRCEEGIELASVGRPVPGFEIEVRDDGGEALSDGRVGRIWVRGPSLMKGYFGRDDLTAEVLRDGWLDTGDLGFVHEAELYLVGRAKDVLILRGQNHAPEPLEQAVSELADVRTGCVVAASFLIDGDEGERLYVFAERRRDAEADSHVLAAEIHRLVLERFGLDGEAVVVEPGTLPRTTSGKLRRAETVRLHRRGELEAPGPMSPMRLVRALWRSRVALRRSARRSSRG